MNASVECPISVPLPDGLTLCEDGLVRPTWASHDRLLRDYYDDEWGVPVHDEAGVFERLALEGFQAGLSWRTVLAKREAFREAFGGFSPDAVAVEARRHATTHTPAPASPTRGGTVVNLPPRRPTNPHQVIAHLPEDTRPLPTVTAYDELLSRRQPDHAPASAEAHHHTPTGTP